jgi:hypothetical protein
MRWRWVEVGGNFSNSVLNSFVCSFFGEKGQIKHPRVILLLFFSPGLVHRHSLGTSFPLALREELLLDSSLTAVLISDSLRHSESKPKKMVP